jgi:SAM-dependent methyltransferase
MVVDRVRRRPRDLAPDATRGEAVWHDLECGSYRADRTVWLELAGAARPQQGARRAGREPARVLDVGAGTGRVSLELARAGHHVTALDLNANLLETLAARADGLDVETVCADARAFSLDRRDFDACFIPMQTIQLLGSRAERMAFLRNARAHVRSGGTLACAIVTAVEPFDSQDGGPAPAPDSGRHRGSLYVSSPTRVAVGDGRVVIERTRHVVGSGAEADRPAGAIEHDVSVLAELTAPELEREAAEAGFRPRAVVAIAPTAEHVGSEVVVFDG